MNSATYQNSIDTWTPGELRYNYAEILQDLKNCLSVLQYYTSNINFHLESLRVSVSKMQIEQDVSSLQSLINRYITLSSQLKGIQLKLNQLGQQLA